MDAFLEMLRFSMLMLTIIREKHQVQRGRHRDTVDEVDELIQRCSETSETANLLDNPNIVAAYILNHDLEVGSVQSRYPSLKKPLFPCETLACAFMPVKVLPIAPLAFVRAINRGMAG
jgi:hypothetical protein